MTAPTLDAAALYVALRRARAARKITFTALAEQAGVSKSTITRISYGNNPSVDGYLRLVAWLGHTGLPYAREATS